MDGPQLAWPRPFVFGAGAQVVVIGRREATEPGPRIRA